MKAVSNRPEFLIELNNFLPDERVCCEIGVLEGDFSEKILRTINPFELYLIDPWDIGVDKYGHELNYIPTAYSTDEQYRNIKSRFFGEKFLGQVKFDRNYSFNAVKNYPDKKFDLIYLDADHRYESVKKDLNDWLPKLKDDGIMAGHDYMILDEFGVEQAVKEFIKEHGFEMILFNLDGGDWALKKK